MAAWSAAPGRLPLRATPQPGPIRCGRIPTGRCGTGQRPSSGPAAGPGARASRSAACRRRLVARRSELRQGKEGDRETAQAAFLAAEHGSTSRTPPWRSSRSRSREVSDRLLAPAVGPEASPTRRSRWTARGCWRGQPPQGDVPSSRGCGSGRGRAGPRTGCQHAQGPESLSARRPRCAGRRSGAPRAAPRPAGSSWRPPRRRSARSARG